MTENERIERERKWVLERFNCTIESVFETLTAVIESDIASYNKLRGGEYCTVRKVDGKNVTFSYGNRVSSLTIDGALLRAEHICNSCHLFSLEIQSKWNEDAMNCDLFIDGEKVSMHRASQKIIGAVLFS